MPVLPDGHYVGKTVRRVVTWAAPDANGDGDVEWENQLDPQGRVIGRVQQRDKYGNVLRKYKAPEGFHVMRTSGGEDIHVYHENGEVYRDAAGSAVNIKPGQAVVFEPDGTTTVLEDEYAQYLFSQAHDSLTAVTE